MLSYEITYEDFDGKKVTETLYFNLSKLEIIEINAEHDGGLEKFLDQSLKTDDFKNLVREFKKIILMSYGKRTEDGRGFEKDDAIQKKFSQSLAFDALFTNFLTDEKFMSYFIMGVIPKDFAEAIEKAEQIQNVELPPPSEETLKE